MNKLILVFSLLFCLTACSEDINNASISADTPIADQLKTPMQKFNIVAEQDTILTGTNGTVIYYTKGILEGEDGEIISGEIELELIELSNQKDFALNGLGTVSNGKLLVSGGAYFIGFRQNEEKLKLKKGETLEVQFPVLADEKMNIFYGEIDQSNQINWNESDVELVENENKAKGGDQNFDTIPVLDSLGGILYMSRSAAEDLAVEFATDTILFNTITYRPTALHSLGWINCDRFLETKNLTKLTLEIKNQEIDASRAYLIFKDINSVMSRFSYEENILEFSNIPEGYDVRLIVFSEEDEISAFAKDFLITKNMHLQVELIKMDTSQFEALFEL